MEGRELEDVLTTALRTLPETKGDRSELASLLVEQGVMSQRQASDFTGIARDTIRKHGTALESENE